MWSPHFGEVSRRGGLPRSAADVAQLVEHHLAKVRVAGSSPVVRSERSWPHPLTTRLRGGGRLFTRWSGREARQRTANPYTRVQIPSPPRAAGAVVARFPDTEEVTGSNPVSPTRTIPRHPPGIVVLRALAPSVRRPTVSHGWGVDARSSRARSPLPVPARPLPGPQRLVRSAAPPPEWSSPAPARPPPVVRAASWPRPRAPVSGWTDWGRGRLTAAGGGPQSATRRMVVVGTGRHDGVVGRRLTPAARCSRCGPACRR